MARHLIELDRRTDASVSGPRYKHNRWHPDIEPVLTIRSGDTDTTTSATGRTCCGTIRPELERPPRPGSGIHAALAVANDTARTLHLRRNAATEPLVRSLCLRLLGHAVQDGP